MTTQAVRARSLTAEGERLRSGATTAPELVEAALGNLAQAEDLMPFVAVHADEARAVAGGLQTLLDAGYDLGPLHGIPISVKDNIAEKGKLNRAGSRVLDEAPAAEDAAVVERLRRAGAVLIGRTTMHELAWGGTTDNVWDGRCRNPWDPGRTPGGSSGGAGVSVVVGACSGALGTDTGGSVRLPSSMVGLTGLRPTIGRIPTRGVVPLAWTMDTVGPMAATARDCAAIYNVIAGPDPADATTAAAPRVAPSAGRTQILRGLRVGIVRDYTWAGIHPDVEAAVRGMVEVLIDCGATAHEVVLPDLDVLVDAQIVVDAAEPSAVHARNLRERGDRIGVEVRGQLEAGFVFTSVEYIQAQRYRAHLSAAVAANWSDVDVLLTPTMPFTAPRSAAATARVGSAERDILTALMQFTALPSMAGLPAMSVPCGRDEDGLPIGAQIIGPAWGEQLLLSVAAEYQAHTDHHGWAAARRPESGA